MVELKFKNQFVELIISRPEVKNAINAELINTLLEKLAEIEQNKEMRCLVIKGQNKVFSSGADLNWLKNINHLEYDEIYEDSLSFVQLLNKINHFSIPVISVVDGPAIGGGAGIALSSDIVIGTENTIFGISELYYGIVPAAIVPIVKQRIGETRAREYLITGERIKSEKAYEFGMLNYLVKSSEVDRVLTKLVNKLISNAPQATKKVREMIRVIEEIENKDEYIAKTIADLRISEEGKEGINAFLEKRKPKWDN